LIQEIQQRRYLNSATYSEIGISVLITHLRQGWMILEYQIIGRLWILYLDKTKKSVNCHIRMISNPFKVKIWKSIFKSNVKHGVTHGVLKRVILRNQNLKLN